MDGFDSIRTSDPPSRQLGSALGSGIWLGEEVVYFSRSVGEFGNGNGQNGQPGPGDLSGFLEFI